LLKEWIAFVDVRRFEQSIASIIEGEHRHVWLEWALFLLLRNFDDRQQQLSEVWQLRLMYHLISLYYLDIFHQKLRNHRVRRARHSGIPQFIPIFFDSR
jgi:hypothetical protein